MTSTSLPIVPMPHQRVLRVSGRDAEAFLQAQLSRSMAGLTAAESRLAGWHDARGRVRAVFRVLTSASGFLLSVPTDLAESVCAALRMYVLRAQVQIDVTDLVCSGAAARNGESLAGEPGAGLPRCANAVTGDGPKLSICVAPQVWHFIAPPEESVLAHDAAFAPVDAAEIRAGLPRVDSRTTGRYVAHMLNLDRLGALDFKKGCYPGQEVIARTEHLGRVRRRACAFVTHARELPESESPIVDADDARIGTVLRAARDTDSRIWLLGVMALDSLGGGVHLGAADGPQLERIELPFE